MNKKELQEINHKMKVLQHAAAMGNISRSCRYWGISRDAFYRWKRNYELRGEAGLINSKPCPENIKLRVSKEIEEKVLHLRCTYHFGPSKISWYLKQYLQMNVSMTGVYGVLCRHGLNRLPKNLRKRHSATIKRYQKQVPGHHIQVDVKFLDFKEQSGRKIKRYQYTAIDDARKIRALKIYERHNQANAIDFINYVVEKFPFRIKAIRIDNGHEFQAKFHWNVEDLGMLHVYIKPASPNLNGKVERSHLTDKQKFYQLLNYTNDVDLKAKLTEWESFYNFQSSHGAFQRKTPYEVLVEKLKSV